MRLPFGVPLLAVSAALLTLGAGGADAQAPPATAPERIRLAIDCVRLFCDTEYFREQLAFVDHVRDPAVADVHVLVTDERTAAGGVAYTLQFIGRGPYAGPVDTLRYVAPVSASDHEIREHLARRIAAGVLPAVARTPAIDDVRVSRAASAGEPSAGQTQAADDPWNYWVFRTRVSGNASGEKSRKSFTTFGSLSANRTTDAWKVNATANGNYSEDKFSFSGGSFSSYSHSLGANLLIVKSLGGQWSAGGRASLSAATRINQRLAVRLAPAVEYNFFPYAEGTRRQLTLQYSVGVNRVAYEEETIFDKTLEYVADESLILSYDVKRGWGSISSSLEGAHYLHDTQKWRLVNFTSMDVRLFRGLSFNLFASASLIRDQLYIPKVSPDPEDVLLQRRQLATSYRYFAGFGLNYTFGSIFNNVVNTRFGGSPGGVFFF